MTATTDQEEELVVVVPSLPGGSTLTQLKQIQKWTAQAKAHKARDVEDARRRGLPIDEDVQEVGDGGGSDNVGVINNTTSKFHISSYM